MMKMGKRFLAMLLAVVMLVGVMAAMNTGAVAANTKGIPKDAVQFSGHYYKYISTAMKWHDAKAYCEKLGGYLLSITSEDENNFINTAFEAQFKTVRGIAIGLTDEEAEGVWSWTSGEPYSYSNWRNGEPNNQGDEDYVVLGSRDGKWNDGHLERENWNFICEWGDGNIPKGDYLKSKKAPIVSIKSKGHGTLTVGIKTVEGATGYQIKYKRATDKNYTALNTIKTKKVINLTPGEKYQVRVRAYAKNEKGCDFTKYTKEKTIKIYVGKSISDTKIVLDGGKRVAHVYDGTAQKPVVSIKTGLISLKQGTDYSIVYSNNVNAGTATVTANGKGKYYGTVSTTFTIKRRGLSDTKISVSKKASTTYTGNPVCPEIELKGPAKITPDDYKVKYENNTAVGTAKIVVTGKRNFKGTLEKSFKIKPANISEVNISLLPDNYNYLGSDICQAVIASFNGKQLVRDADYTVRFVENGRLGTVELAGINNFKGTVQKAVYDLKVTAFTNDERWRDGVWWGDEKHYGEVSPWDSWSCCAYAADFAKYMFNENSPSSGTQYTDANEIRAGDILYCTDYAGNQHWLAVLYRDGSQLITAEGNHAQHVRISSSAYTVQNGSLLGDYLPPFAYGYHYQ